MIKILLIGDIDEVFKIPELMNAEIMHSTDVDEALELTKTQHFDCIILDCEQPECDSELVIGKLIEEEIVSPIIIVDNHGDEVRAVKTIKAGAYDYLPRNRLNLKSLIQVIKSAIKSSETKVETVKKLNEIREVIKKLNGKFVYSTVAVHG